MLGKVKMIAGGVLALGVLFTVYMGYRHYNKVLDARNLAVQTNTVLQTALDIEAATVRDLRNAAGDWRTDRAELLANIEEMQEAADEAEREKKHLRELFASMDWSAALADSVATATTDRLFGLIATSSEYRDGGSGETDPSATTGAETD